MNTCSSSLRAKDSSAIHHGTSSSVAQAHVPGFPTPACCCGAQWETAKHVVLECPRLQRVHRSLYTATATTLWFLRHGVLPQFSWAQESSWILATSQPPPPTFYRLLERIALPKALQGEVFFTLWNFPSLIP